MVNLFLMLIVLASCSTYSKKSVIQGITDNRSIQANGICYQVMIGEEFKTYSERTICSDKYPDISKGDRVLISLDSNDQVHVELEKLKSFETFFSSMADKRSINYYAFVYFDEKKMINHDKYRKEWSSSCLTDGLYCRLLAYLEKSENNESQFFKLMDQGCKDKDIISCFNIIMRKEDLKDSQKLQIKKGIKKSCLKVKDTDSYHDFCGELLHGI